MKDEISKIKTPEGMIIEKSSGHLTEQERLVAAKQILMGLGVIFLICVVAFFYCPVQGNIFLEICQTTLPPLATLIIAFYFKERH